MALPNSIAKSDLATLLGLTTAQLNNVDKLEILVNPSGVASWVRVVTFREWSGTASKRNIPKIITLT